MKPLKDAYRIAGFYLISSQKRVKEHRRDREKSMKEARETNEVATEARHRKQQSSSRQTHPNSIKPKTVSPRQEGSGKESNKDKRSCPHSKSDRAP